MASGVTLNDIKGNAPDDQKQIRAEIKTAGDMLNLLGTLHGGCAAYLIDICTSIAIAVAPQGVNNPSEWWGKTGVSQALNVLYHAPARSGTTLKIISETIVLGGRAGTVRCEIWDMPNNTLVASGTHTKMPLAGMRMGKL
ncbi:unnamed protein product [Rhizoctonia solani]|uniref:Thioesterase domain-containing protein n=1 Tax=Rhizoctonia solani TaxID=456999 RepID=A0A8H3DF74_9AGAM|nr:unnamed protein product [Rhizoctonia solani]